MWRLIGKIAEIATSMVAPLLHFDEINKINANYFLNLKMTLI